MAVCSSRLPVHYRASASPLSNPVSVRGTSARGVLCDVKHLAPLFFSPFLSFVSSAHYEWFSEERSIMGTLVDVELWHEDSQTAHGAIEAVMPEMHRMHYSDYLMVSIEMMQETI